jgi:transposase-like protein
VSQESTSQEHLAPPKACPACRSTDLTSTSKTVTVTSYWRCLRCGEVWNEERRGGTRYVPRRW